MLIFHLIKVSLVWFFKRSLFEWGKRAIWYWLPERGSFFPNESKKSDYVVHFVVYYDISQVDRWEREIRDLTKIQVSAIIWTILLTWLRTKNGGCVSHDVKKNIQNTKQQKINENVLMLLFLFEINSMESIKRRFMFNF